MKQEVKRILVVDDDPELRDYLAKYLADHGYEVVAAMDAPGADRALGAAPVDLVILDIGLPGEDGLSVCRRVTGAEGPCVIIASAAGEELDRVLGLELGADDYLPKPFSPRELLARVKAVLRRREHAGRALGGATYRAKGFSFDPARRQLSSPAGALVLLTGAEAGILGLLFANPRRAVSREQFESEGVLQSNAGGRALDLQMSRLRRKLEANGGGDLIRTQRGLGYILDCDVAHE